MIRIKICIGCGRLYSIDDTDAKRHFIFEDKTCSIIDERNNKPCYKTKLLIYKNGKNSISQIA